jgi:antitoxin MazE
VRRFENLEDVLLNEEFPGIEVKITVQVSMWGNGLAVRLPVALVELLDLKEGDGQALARLRSYRGRMPADFKFDRLEANKRKRNN